MGNSPGVTCQGGQKGEEFAVTPSSPGPSRAGPRAGRTSFPLSFQELVEFYQQNSLKDCFKSLDTTLQFPFKEPEKRAISKPPGRGLRLAACCRGQVWGCHGHACGHAEARSVQQREVLLTLVCPFALEWFACSFAWVERWGRGYFCIWEGRRH